MPKKFRLWAMFFFAAVLLPACSNIVYKPMLAQSDYQSPRKIAIFFDGTHNDIADDTNVKRLHALVSLQDRKNLATLYIEGVGVGNDVLGAGTGLGIGPRVRLAYQFLLDNYRKINGQGDEIYIFGFSRGAYSARILASLLYHAGLPESPPANSDEVAQKVFSAVKVQPGDTRDTTEVRKSFGLTPTRIKVLGLWDTVEALGVPDWYSRILNKTGISLFKVDIDEPNPRYGDQLCNVENAFHAVSLDDNREWIFTPLLLTRKHLLAACTREELKGFKPAAVLREVWFSGAHSNVGGGYSDSELSGVSLNWMIRELADAKTGLLKPDTKVREDVYGSSHDPEARWWGPLYHAVTRNVGGYVVGENQWRTELDNARSINRLCVHPSVFERRSAMPPKDHENQQLSLKQPGPVCLTPDREHPADPPRLVETKCPAIPERTVMVEEWPHCTYMTWGYE